MGRLNQPGIYRGHVVEYGAVPAKESQAVAIALKFVVDEALDPKTQQWTDWREFEPQEIDYYGYVVKKNGELNDTTIDQIMVSLGWSGSFADFETDNLKLIPCQFKVDAEEYEGKTRLKVNWLNPWDYAGGGIQNKADTGKLHELDTKFGARLRAKAGNMKRNLPPKPDVSAAPW